MFINTTQTNTNFKTGNNIYDSRITKRKKVEESQNNNIVEDNNVNRSDKVDLEKLRNVTTLYSYNMPVLCSFATIEEEVVGYPISLSEDGVTILVNDTKKTLSLDEIQDFKILEF